MELNELFQMWDRFDASDARELQYTEGSQSFRLSKNAGAGSVNQAGGCHSQATDQPAKQAVKQAPKQVDMTIDSPLAGTFYRAASPEDKPYVMIGQEVKEGDVIGIVESMKMMNEITADKSGIVVCIDAEDGQVVEYHQHLIALEAAHV